MIYNYALTEREKQTLQAISIPDSICSYIIVAKYDGVCGYVATQKLALERANPQKTSLYTTPDIHNPHNSKAMLMQVFNQLLVDLQSKG